MMLTMPQMSYDEISDFVEKLWQDSKSPTNLTRKTCYSCNARLRVKGKERIVYPLSYNGNCLFCGGRLLETRCPG